MGRGSCGAGVPAGLPQMSCGDAGLRHMGGGVSFRGMSIVFRIARGTGGGGKMREALDLSGMEIGW